MFYTFQPKPVFNGNTKLKSLFTITGKADTKPNGRKSLKYKTGALTVSGWLSFSCRDGWIDSVDIIPSEKLLKAIQDNMLYIEYDNIYFEAIPFSEEGKFSLYAKYNLIIGSRLLGWFKLSELGEYYPNNNKKYQIHVLASENNKQVFKPVRPSGQNSAPYEYDTKEEAESMALMCYGAIDQKNVKIVPV